jgi:type I restriction enzyme S subunit
MIDVITDHIDVWTSAQKKKSAVGRGSSSKLELYGIKKLRELILDLAIQGKLVSQDPNDEPASELLKKIEKERLEIVKKKIPKASVITKEDKKPFALPSKWEWVRLEQIIQISSGDGLTSTNMNQNGDVPVYGGNGITGYHDRANTDKPILVIGRVGYYCGSIHLTPLSSWVTDNAFKTTFSENNIDINFLSWLLKGTDLKENENATAQPVISGRKIYPIIVALPPFNEQIKIANKIKELMSLCDQLEQEEIDNKAAHQTLVKTLLNTLTSVKIAEEFTQSWQRISEHFDILFTTEESIEELKQAILQLAVMGKLVPQDPNDEPASGLIKKIEEEKKSLYKQGLIKKQELNVSILTTNTPFNLPKTWEWVSLASIGIGSTGKTPKTSCSECFGGTIPFLGPGQITPSGTIIEAEKTLTEKGSETSTIANTGDILMVCIGGSIGKSAIVKDKVAFNQQINAIRPIFINTRFLNIAMETNQFQESVLENASGTATPIINKSKWESLLIPIAPLKEQNRIIVKVDELMALCDLLNANISEAQDTQVLLADTIVHQVVV